MIWDIKIDNAAIDVRHVVDAKKWLSADSMYPNLVRLKYCLDSYTCLPRYLMTTQVTFCPESLPDYKPNSLDESLTLISPR